MKHDVFISYKSSSLPIVRKLAELLEQNDINCWYAPRNLNEDGLGKEFDDEIVNAIKNVPAVIVLLNDDALQSKWVKRELTQAEKHGKMILPFVIAELTVENGLLMRLEDKHMINAYPNPEENFSTLLNSVQKLLNKTPVSKIGSDPNPPDDTKPERIDGGTPDGYDLDFEEGMAFLEAEDEKNAFLSFLRSAERHNKKAYEQLFKIMHINNKNADFLDEETWEHIEELSDEGEAFADLLMHYRYFGMGTQNEIALKYLQRALDKQVSPYALLQMGVCYGWGLGVKLSSVMSMHYYNKAYEAGCAEATRYIAQAYMYGNDKVEKDLAKAEAVAKEGAEIGVLRCYSMLAEIYLECHREEEVKQLAQYMIDHHIKGGYCRMGEYYAMGKQDTKTAKVWFMRATEHKEKEAWGYLCYLAWLDDDLDEAFRLGKKGVHENDSWSYSLLGNLYALEGKTQDFGKAWEYYMAQVRKYGTSANSTALLYLDQGYTPDENAIAELKHYLVLDSLQERADSIQSLLRIMLIENGQKPVITYDALRALPQAFEYVRRGAETPCANGENAELQYIYARILLEDSGQYHDPYKGEKMMVEAAKNGHKEAIKYVFNTLDEENLSAEVAHRLIQTKSCPAEHIGSIAKYGKERASEEEILAWIPEAAQVIGDKDEYTCERCALYKMELDVYKAMQKTIPDDELQRIRENIRAHQSIIIETGALSMLKEHISLLFPSYNPTRLLRGDISDKQQFELFFGMSHSPSNLTKYASEPLERDFYEYLRQGLDTGGRLSDTVTRYNELRKAYENALQAYTELQALGDADTINEELTFSPAELTPCCTSRTANEHLRRAMKMIFAAHRAFGDEWPNIFKNMANDDEVLNCAECLTNPTAQFALVSLVEVAIEAESINIENDEIRIIIEGRSKRHLYKILNERIERMNTEGIHHHLRLFDDNTPLPAYFARLFEKYADS